MDNKNEDIKNKGYDIKEWYSLDEIKELEPRIIESLKIINEYESKVKIK